MRQRERASNVAALSICARLVAFNAAARERRSWPSSLMSVDPVTLPESSEQALKHFHEAVDRFERRASGPPVDERHVWLHQ
jgi:hypothetical protein